MASNQPATDSFVAGRYPLLRLLGEGGMGAVFESSRDGERVALKLIHTAGSTPEIAQRFLRETRVASTIKSEHLVPVLDSGVDPTTAKLFLVMPLVEGEDLGAAIARLGPLPPVVAVRLTLQVARGIAALHSANVVHRDIKPSNVLLSIEDGGVLARVCDFGIAKDLNASEGVTATGAILGSPLYMAPEQMLNAKLVGTKADLWSLGAMLYEALAGRAPFADVRSLSELVVRVCNEDIPHLQDAAPWVPQRLATAVHATLLRDVAARCPSVDALIEELLPFVDRSLTVPASALQALGADDRARVAPRAARPTSWATDLPPSYPATPSYPIPELVGGQFRVVRELGRGGMGAVYEAEKVDGGKAALKIIVGGESRDMLRRFAREARAVMSIESEHVVRVLAADADPPEGPAYLAMELLHGVDLDALVRETGPLEPHATARLFVQVCRGLSAAHANRIVHRDIKPANIFLNETASGVVTKICDFGIAKHSALATGTQNTTLDLTRTGGLLGSPLYMSPEQARNAKHVDYRTDIWSASIALYEALTGQKPWAGCTTTGELILAICTGRIAPVQDLAPWVAPELSEIVHRGLEPDPTLRWATAEAMASALEGLASPEPLTRADLRNLTAEQRASVADRHRALREPQERAGAERATRRRRWIVSGASAGVLAVAIGAFFFRAPAHDEPTREAPQKQAPPTQVTVNVRVRPETARATVGGEVRALGPGGVLTLTGYVGDSFGVTLEVGAARTSANVVILRDGTASPALIEVPLPPPVSAAPVSAAMTKPVRSPSAVGGRSQPRKPAGVAAVAAPAPEVPEPSPEPKFKDTL